MKYTITILVAALCMALVTSYPLRQGEGLQSEALNRLMMVEGERETALRSKRTIGILRQLFPGVSQIVEQKVNSIVAEVIRVLGPVVLRNFLANNRGGDGSAGGTNGAGSTVTVASPFGEDEDEEDMNSRNSGSRVQISLPTFPPDEDEETEAPQTTTIAASRAIDTTTSSPFPSISLLSNFDVRNVIDGGSTSSTDANTAASL